VSCRSSGEEENKQNELVKYLVCPILIKKKKKALRKNREGVWCRNGWPRTVLSTKVTSDQRPGRGQPGCALLGTAFQAKGTASTLYMLTA
jgi:hypothetical protein